MGIFSFFSERRKRENAMTGLDPAADRAQEVAPLTTEIHGLGDLGAMVTQLHQLKESGAQLQTGGQVIDLRGAINARKEVFEVLRQHGVDPAGGGGMPKDPETMQRDIMAALQRSGIDLSAYGAQMMQPPASQPGALPDASSPGSPANPDDPDGGILDPLR